MARPKEDIAFDCPFCGCEVESVSYGGIWRYARHPRNSCFLSGFERARVKDWNIRAASNNGFNLTPPVDGAS